MNERAFVGVGDNLPPHQAHPNFNPADVFGDGQPLKAFYDSTMAAKMAAPNGVCGPSKLLN
jgi:hypothetical protein